MSTIQASRCGSCGAAVFWVVTESKAKRMPVDWEGDRAGTFWIVQNDDGVGGDKRVPLAVHHRALKPGQKLMRRGRRLSHFATCPDSAGWRK